MLVTPYLKDKKYQDFLRYNIDFIGFDSLCTLSNKSAQLQM